MNPPLRPLPRLRGTLEIGAKTKTFVSIEFDQGVVQAKGSSLFTRTWMRTLRSDKKEPFCPVRSGKTKATLQLLTD
ncbi:hypothetical protein [Burkholderia ubonensis]|uniref:hypothetical protein n=1 Tax=Burkholderia ubonensis TaxID=101571 RepID=UPI0018DF5AB3|nr:hypothetical protein [Burkholderia ubonensis]